MVPLSSHLFWKSNEYIRAKRYHIPYFTFLSPCFVITQCIFQWRKRYMSNGTFFSENCVLNNTIFVWNMCGIVLFNLHNCINLYSSIVLNSYNYCFLYCLKLLIIWFVFLFHNTSVLTDNQPSNINACFFQTTTKQKSPCKKKNIIIKFR